MPPFPHLSRPGSLPQKIPSVLETVRTAAQKPAVVLLQAIATPLKLLYQAIVNKLLQLIGKGKRPPLIDHTSFGAHQDKQLWVDDQGEVQVRASQPQPLRPTLQKLAQNASGTRKQQIQDALQAEQDLAQTGQRLKAKGQSPTFNQPASSRSRASNKGTADPKTKAEVKEIARLRKQGERQQQALAKKLESILGCSLASGSCFVAGTPVHTAAGRQAIESVPVGCAVRTLDKISAMDRRPSRPWPGDESGWRVVRLFVCSIR